jgi:hypothetical protein
MSSHKNVDIQVVGSERDAVLHAMHLLNRKAEERGWDLPSSLWYLQTGEIDGMPSAELRLAQVFTGHPADDLIGTYAPSAARVAFLITEGWTYPDGVRVDETPVMPADHPHRVELRIVTAVGKDGSCEMLHHIRGHDRPQIVEEMSMPANQGRSQLVGRVFEALRIHLGAPRHGDLPTPQDGMLALQLLRMASSAVDMLASEPSGVEDINLTGLILTNVVYGAVTGDLSIVDPSIRATIGALLDGLPPEHYTWADMQRDTVDELRRTGDAALRAYYEWMDADGFACEILGLERPYPGDELVALIPPEARRPVAELLEQIGLRCSEAALS